MIVKLSSLALLRRTPRWVFLNRFLSSLSCAKDVDMYPETDRFSPELESNLNCLNNNLHPYTLIHALDSFSDVNSSLKLFQWASLQKGFQLNADTYYRMILKLGMSGNIIEMEDLCNEMVKANCLGSREVLLELMDSLVKCERFDESLRVLFCFNSCKLNPSLAVFNALMGELVKEKRDFIDVLFVYKELVKSRMAPNVDTINYLLEGLLDADRIDMALSQYRRMSKKSCSPNSRTFEVLISGLIAKDHVDEALVIVNEMLAVGCELDLCFFNRMIPLLCSVDKFNDGMILFMRMKDSGHAPNLPTYRVIIQGLCRNLLVDDAVKHFKELIDDGLEPTEDIHVEILEGLCKLYRFKEAKLFLNNFNVDEICPLNILLGAYYSVGKFSAAKSMFCEMFEMNLTDCLSWNIFFKCLCYNREIKKAFEVLGRMVVASFLSNSDAYNALIVCKCGHDDFKDVLKLFNHVQRKSWVLDSRCYAEFVEYLCQKRKIQEALKVFCYMSRYRFPLHLNSFNVLLTGVCNTGDIINAINVMFLGHASMTSCSTVTYNIIMRGLSKFKKSDTLLVVLSQLVVNGCFPNEETYSILIQSMSMFDQVENCKYFFNLMLSQGVYPSSEALASVLTCLNRHSQLNKILPEIDNFIFSSSSVDESNFNMILCGLWKEGYKSEASRYLDIMLDRGWVPDSTTHRLLMGSVLEEESGTRLYADETVLRQDVVSSILAEALSES